VLEEELGAGRVVGVEVWHLRSGQQELVSPAQAAATLDRVETIVHRVAGSGP
jgi:hypothetical protein